MVLAEIVLSAVDFHLSKGQVALYLLAAAKRRGPKRLPTNTRYAWEVVLRCCDEPDPTQINRATTYVSAVAMSMLGEMSLLPSAEFRESFTSRFEKSSLAIRRLVVNAYQRMYRYLLPPKKFTALRHR